MRWVLKRNCSAGPALLALVFASITAVSFAVGIAFAMRGYWLILPFAGIELLAVGAAFLCYGRHAADYERIEIDGGRVQVESLDGSRCRLWQAQAAWTRVETDVSGRLVPTPHVYLATGGRRVEVGVHLRPEGRRSLAAELTAALRATGPMQTA
jgi:uncharacterized membrane protein